MDEAKGVVPSCGNSQDGNSVPSYGGSTARRHDLPSGRLQIGVLVRNSAKAVTSILFAACGPQVSATSGGEEGTGGAHASTTEATSETSASSTSPDTTDHAVECGDGLLDAGEWCFDRLSVSIAELGLEQAFRVVATPDGLVVWGDNGFSQLSVVEDAPAFENDPFYENGYEGGYVIYLANLAEPGTGRPDMFYWTPVDVVPDVDPSLSRQTVFLSPGASRPEPGSDAGSHRISEFDPTRDDLIAPLDVDDEETDAFFAYDRNTRVGAVYRRRFPSSAPRPSGFDVELLEPLDVELPCAPSAIHTGDFNGDGREDGVLVAADCEATESATLYVFAGGSMRPLDPEPSSLELPLAHEAFTLAVLDFNEDSFHDLVITEPGQLLLLTGGPNGLSEPLALEPTPVEAVVEGPSHIPDSDRPLITLASGQFDTTSALEVLVTSEAGVTVASTELGVVGEFPERATSFAAFDLNADGLGDVALITDDEVIIYRSNP